MAQRPRHPAVAVEDRYESPLSPRKRASAIISRESHPPAQASTICCDAYGHALRPYSRNKLVAVEQATVYVRSDRIREMSDTLRQNPETRVQQIIPKFPDYRDPLQVCDTVFLAWLVQAHATRPEEIRFMAHGWQQFMRHYVDAEVRHLSESNSPTGEPGLGTAMRMAAYAQPYYEQVVSGRVDAILGDHPEMLLNLLWKSRYLVGGTSFEELGYAFYGRSFYRLQVCCTPNCRLIIDPATGTGYLTTLRAISSGERLSICDYQPYPCPALRAVERRWHHEYNMCQCAVCTACECVGWRDSAERDRALADQFVMQRLPDAEFDADRLWLCDSCILDGGICPQEKLEWVRMAHTNTRLESIDHETQFMELLGDHGTSTRAVDCACTRCYLIYRLLGLLFARRTEFLLSAKYLTKAYNTLRSWKNPHFLADAQVLEAMLISVSTHTQPTDTWASVLTRYSRDLLLSSRDNGSSGDVRSALEKKRHPHVRGRAQSSVGTSKSSGSLSRTLRRM